MKRLEAMPTRVLGLACAVLLGGALVFSISAQTSDQPTAAAASQAQQWPDYAGSPEGNRYVESDQITKANVDKLEVAWTYPYADTNVNAIVAGGVIYTHARDNSAIVALDAATGKEIWVHDGLTGMTRRGLNYWQTKDGKDKRLVFAVGDFLQEIDATTGKSILTFGTNGAVDLHKGLGRDPNFRSFGQSVGKVFDNLILLGSSDGEVYFSPPGDIRAFNVLTGKLAWQFHTIPHPGEPGYKTWPKDAWKYSGGANDWGEFSIDSARGIAYFVTASAKDEFYGADRVGDDLYADCLLAINARTGKLLWHFQTVHHDIWDYDNVAAPMLTTITRNGKKIDVVALAGKTGYLYVFNRVTGEPIWPIPETPVPHPSPVPGEVVSPTQPIPVLPPPFTSHSFTVADIDPYILTPEQRAALTDRVSEARFQGFFTPIGFDETIHMPGNQGGTNFGMTSANPTDGSVYVMALNYPTLIKFLPPGQSRVRAGGAGGSGAQIYSQNCAVCHGADRAGQPGSIPPLTGIADHLSRDQIQATIQGGKGRMPSFQQFSNAGLNALITYLITGGAGRAGRGARPSVTFPPGPVVQTGPTETRTTPPYGTSTMTDYPKGVPHPEYRLNFNDYGVEMEARKPPYTSLTAYDLNTGTIKWQIGVGDDYRVVSAGGPHGTGADEDTKTSSLVTSTGLVIVAAADHRIHFYDADTGQELRSIDLGATTSGSPSAYELNGRQYLLFSASCDTGCSDKAADPNQKGPVGLIALALPQ
ncbi:MAG TPA: PQQ-binding-like beta-propeller repeat protein [Candidatus Aquilonibacter sp.]|nr:PQQ-binding-like beta-propeller repeat protein [Candidatus Aquilonibacter sp.]